VCETGCEGSRSAMVWFGYVLDHFRSSGQRQSSLLCMLPILLEWFDFRDHVPPGHSSRKMMASRTDSLWLWQHPALDSSRISARLQAVHMPLGAVEPETLSSPR